jgi:hypothetical protein
MIACRQRREALHDEARPIVHDVECCKTRRAHVPLQRPTVARGVEVASGHGVRVGRSAFEADGCRHPAAVIAQKLRIEWAGYAAISHRR